MIISDSIGLGQPAAYRSHMPSWKAGSFVLRKTTAKQALQVHFRPWSLAAWVQKIYLSKKESVF